MKQKPLAAEWEHVVDIFRTLNLADGKTEPSHEVLAGLKCAFYCGALSTIQILSQRQGQALAKELEEYQAEMRNWMHRRAN